MPRVLAVDIGTSRIKAALFDEKGNMEALADRRLERADSPSRQDARMWYESVCLLLRSMDLTRRIPDAVALTGNMHALLGIGPDGEPVEDAFLWSDSSAEKESDWLNERWGDFLKEFSGNASIPVFTLPKILKMKKERPEAYSSTRRFLNSKDYIAWRLTGNFATDPTDASGTQMMSLSRHSWESAFLSELSLDPGKLPEILPSSSSFCGHVTPEAAEATGLPSGVKVVIGAGDLATAALGSGVDEDTFSLTLGTAGQLLADGPAGPGGKLIGKIFLFAHAEKGRELYLGSVPGGGFSLEWLSARHNRSMTDFFRMASEDARLTEDLPLFLPYLLGRGAPYMDYRPAGAWLGLKALHTEADLYRGAVFGTLCPLRQCADLMESLSGRRRGSLVLQALACREKAVRETASALFRQERKLLPLNSEASLLGAAMLGMCALNVYDGCACARNGMFRAEKMALPATQLGSSRDAAQKLYARFLSAAGGI